LLGTAGGPRPRKTRSASAQTIVVGDAIYIVDCGDGVARQLVNAGLALNAPSAAYSSRTTIRITTPTTAICCCWPGRVDCARRWILSDRRRSRK